MDWLKALVSGFGIVDKALDLWRRYQDRKAGRNEVIVENQANANKAAAAMLDAANNTSDADVDDSLRNGKF